jgi:hypothetical protein
LSNGVRSVLSFVGCVMNKSRVWSLYLVSFLVGLRTYQHTLVFSPHTLIIFLCTHCLLSWTVPRNWGSIPGRAGCFALPYLSVTHVAFHLVRNGVFFPGG